MDISIIIVNWNTKDLLFECLNSIISTVKDLSFEILIVDNASADGSVKAIRSRYPDINVIENKENLGFAIANNLALNQMNGQYALLLNTDALLTENAVRALYDFMESRPNAAIACGQLLNHDGSKQNSIANFPSLASLMLNETLLRVIFPNKYPSKRREYSSPIEIESCIGACMIVRKSSLDEVGMFDEDYFFFFEETDLAYRMKQAGWKTYFIPTVRIFHAQGKSVGTGANSRIMFYRSRYIYVKKSHKYSYPFIYTVIFIRLFVNTLLSLLGILLTFGLVNSLKMKLITYTQLITWHLKGCPQ